ncbi:cytochrome P450 [Aureobasidium subglaciale]|nr:cytochrome P450 [Aureobasidium subglaciale]
MVNSHNPGLLMWLLLIVPLKEPCWPHCSKICYHVMGLRSGLRVCLLAYLSLSVLPSSYRFRASPQTGLSWLLIGAGIHTILHVAMITEACRLPELSDPGTYHDLLLEYFVSDFFFLLSVRELFKIFHLVPGPCLAKFTFFWKGRHLARGSYERALLRAHQAHAYSVARPSLTLELQHKLHLIHPSKPHLALPHVFKDAYMRYGMSEQLMSQAANNELVIDASVDGLLDSLAKSTKQDVPEIMGAATMGQRFSFVDSTAAGNLADKLADLRTESSCDGSFLRFHPWITKILSCVSQDDTSWVSLFKTTMLQGHSGSEKQDDATTKAMQTHYGVRSSSEHYHHSILSFFIGAADPIATHLQTVVAYLAYDSNSQARIKDEMRSCFSGHPFTFEDLLNTKSTLPYLDAILREADRLAASEKLVLGYYADEDKYHGENIAWTNSDSMQSSIYLARLAASRLNPAVGDNCDGWNPDKWLNGTDMPCKSYQFQITINNMSSITPTIVFLSAEDLEQMLVCIKSPALSKKLSAINNPSGAVLITADPKAADRLLAVFEGDAKDMLSRYIKNPDQVSKFTPIKSVALERDQRREIHQLVRQFSKGKLDSGLDNKTSRIEVFLRGSASEYHKQESQDTSHPRQQGPKQQRGPARPSPYLKNNKTHPATNRAALATRGVAPRTAPSVTLTPEQKARTAVWLKEADQLEADNKAAWAKVAADARNAPAFEFKSADYSGIEVSFKLIGESKPKPTA